MALYKPVQLLLHENLSPATNPNVDASGTFTSQPIPWGNEAGWLLVIRTGAAVTGTTPGITWELDLNDNGGGFVRVGAAIAAVSAAGVLVVPYFTGTTQGPVVPSPVLGAGGHTYVMQVKGVFGATDNVATDISVELVAIE